MPPPPGRAPCGLRRQRQRLRRAGWPGPNRRRPLRPLSPYAAAKLAGELYCQAFTTSLWPGNGPAAFLQHLRPAQRADSPYSGVIALFTAALTAGRTPTVFGDGLQTRDFTYVTDVVQALQQAAEVPGIAGRVYNVGTGRQVSLLDLLAALNPLLGTHIVPKHQPARPGDIRHSCADISRIRRDLAYEPTVAFETGLAHTLAWYRQQSS